MDNLNYADDPTLSIDKKVAIVGIGCRFPNDIKNVREFWQTVADGRDCTIPHPPERLDPSYIYPGDRFPGKIYTRRAGYLKQDVYAFDREFFHISPDEASHMDPQLRLLLEVAWETLEDYGVNVDSLIKSPTGVYVGIMAREYVFELTVPDDNVDQYTATGNNGNMLSNRISYHFDFQGPSVTIDTACSSSMYAIHYACEAIRNKECDMALAGGVNLLLSPSTTIQLCQARLVCQDGRCKAFDNLADGYARADGAGMLLLKPLKRAIEDGDRIYAVIRGGALNNDGRTKGITTPNVESQARLLKCAYDAANVLPQEVSYVEAHGTGTQAGDVAEATSIGTVLGVGRNEHHPPLIIGSVKTNIGHTEGAAGVASVIKTCLVLQKKKIPKVVHLQRGNEKIDWDKLNLTLPTELMTWPTGSKYIAGCTAYGFGGANAHLVLEAPPPSLPQSREKVEFFPSILFLSAASREALGQRVSDWLKFLKRQNHECREFQDIIRTAALRSTHLQYRLAIYSESIGQTVMVLEKRLQSVPEVTDDFVEGRAQNTRNDQVQKLAFVFSGMGTQWWGMGRALMQTDEIFKKSILDISAMLKGFGAKWSLEKLLTDETDQDKIHDTDIAQAAICAIQIALVAVYRQLGVYPQVVVGHSVGEIAAACVAGYLTVRNAMRLVYVRGKSLQMTAGKGKMAAILTSVDQVGEKLASSGYDDRIDIACINSPSQTVVSGDSDAVEHFLNLFKSQGVRCVLLKVKNAYHSFQQEQVKEYFLEQTKFLNYPELAMANKSAPPQIPMISSVNGQVLSIQAVNSNEYWWQNIRQTVKFADAMKGSFERGCNVCLEVGPHPSLAPAIRGTMAAFSESTLFHDDYSVISSLRRPPDTSILPADKMNIIMSVAKLHVQGYPLNLNMLFTDAKFEVQSLPNYPWQRQTYDGATSVSKELFRTARTNHPLVGKQTDMPKIVHNIGNERSWKSTYSQIDAPWIHHHRILDSVVLPGAAFIEIMLFVARQICPANSYAEIEHVQFHKFHYSPDSTGTLYTTLSQCENGSDNHHQVVIRTYDETKDALAVNATSDLKFTESVVDKSGKTLNTDTIKGRCDIYISPDKLYNELAGGGIQIGEMFAAISSAWYSPNADEALVIATLPTSLANESNVYLIHPTLLDPIFQLFQGFSLINEQDAKPYVQVPKSVGYLRFEGRAPSEVAIHARKNVKNDEYSLTINIANSANGNILAEIKDVRFAKIDSGEDPSPCHWYEVWEKLEHADGEHENGDSLAKTNFQNDTTMYHLVPDKAGVARALSRLLDDITVHCKITSLEGGATLNSTLAPEEQHFHEHVVCLNFLSVSEETSVEKISKLELIESQTNTTVQLIKSVIIPLVGERKDQSKIWVVTKGAMKTPCDSSVNPLMAKAHALVLTCMHEFPELFIASIDLPHDLPLADCAALLFQFFKSPNTSENCLALRVKDGKVQFKSYDAFALRLTQTRTADFKLTGKTTQWMMDLQSIPHYKGNGYLKLLNNPTEIERGFHTVKLESFTQLSYKDSQTAETHHGFLFAGKVADSNIDKSAVVGYCRSAVVTSDLKCKRRDLALLPKNVSAIDGLVVVKTCLPIFLAIQKVATAEDHYLAVTSTTPLTHLDFLDKYSRLTGVKVMLLVQRLSECSVVDDNCKNVKVVGLEDIENMIDASTIDTLVLSPDVTVESAVMDSLLDKMCVMGTVVSLSALPLKRGKLHSRQVHCRMLDMEFLLSTENQTYMHEMTASLVKLAFNSEYQMDWYSKTTRVVELDKATKSDLMSDCIVGVGQSIDIPLQLTDFVKSFSVESKASYLVVGGTKGLGFAVAHWLVDRGAKLVYISGRNRPTESSSASIEYIKCDVSQREEVIEMLTYITKRGEFPLQGIFHCAAVFNDQALGNPTEENWNTVMLPKSYGALLLHQLTLEFNIELKQFVVISSIAAFMGNKGQGSYSIANRFLASLCQYRRLRGLPATVIAPGTISEVGFAARQGYDKLLETRGMSSLSPREITDTLSWALISDTTVVGLTGHMDKAKFINVSHQSKIQSERNFYSIYKREFPIEESYSPVNNSNSGILANVASQEEAHSSIMAILMEFITQRLGVTDSISSNISLTSIGLDSSMSWELSALINSKFNVSISSVELLNDTLMVFDLVYLIFERSADLEGNSSTNVRKKVSSPNSPWLHEPREVKTARADIICFPCTGMGTTMFIPWSEMYAKNDVRLTVVQLPGWEGRLNEKPSSDLEYIVRELAVSILLQLKAKKTAIVGCGIGALIAFEVIRRLQTHHDTSINHFYVVGWYAPSVPYSSITGGGKLNKGGHGARSKADSNVTFLDNRDIKQPLSGRYAAVNAIASSKICSAYRYAFSSLLECNVSIFSGKRDSILQPKFLKKWKNEVHPDYSYQLITKRTDHKLLRNRKCNAQIGREVMDSLVHEKSTPSRFKNHEQ